MILSKVPFLLVQAHYYSFIIELSSSRPVSRGLMSPLEASTPAVLGGVYHPRSSSRRTDGSLENGGGGALEFEDDDEEFHYRLNDSREGADNADVVRRRLLFDAKEKSVLGSMTRRRIESANLSDDDDDDEEFASALDETLVVDSPSSAVPRQQSARHAFDAHVERLLGDGAVAAGLHEEGDTTREGGSTFDLAKDFEDEMKRLKGATEEK